MSSGGQWGFNYPLLSQLTWYIAIPSTKFKIKPHTFLIKQWKNVCQSFVLTVLLGWMKMIHIVCLICTFAVYLSFCNWMRIGECGCFLCGYAAIRSASGWFMRSFNSLAWHYTHSVLHVMFWDICSVRNKLAKMHPVFVWDNDTATASNCDRLLD